MDIKKPQKKKSIPPSSPPISPIKEITPDKKSLSQKKGIFLISLWIFLLVIIFYASFLFFRINRLGEKINPKDNSGISITKTIKNLATDNFPTLKGENEDRINILLLGIAGEKNPGKNLTDTIIVASVNTKTHKVGLISLPRDIFISLPSKRIESKINSIYQAGLSLNKSDKQKAEKLIQEAVEKITGIPIHYYVLLNFDGFEKIVDSIGGINIMNERNISDSRYPGKNYSYETFELRKGFHHLDGKTALKYARERHSDPMGDFGRAKRQQQVLQAIKNKVFSVKTLMNPLTLHELFKTLGDNIVTNIKIEEFASFINLAQKLDTQNINNVVIDAWSKESLLKVAHIFFGPTRAFALIPKAGNWSETQELSQNIFSLNEIKKRKEAIQKENAKIKLINASGQPKLTNKIKKSLLDHLNYTNIYLDNHPTKVQKDKTFVYDLTNKNKLFTLDEIIKTFPATLSEENLSVENFIKGKKSDFDILVIVGKDLIDVYNVEEGTLEDLEKQSEEIFNNQKI